MAYNQRTWSDFIDQVDAANWNDLESRINSAVSSAVSAISNSQTMLSGTVKLSGAGIVNVGSQTGNAFTISASQSAQPVGSLVPTGNTTGTTASLPFASNIALSGGNKITLSQSTGANSSVVAISAADQTVQTQNLHNVTLSGNTAGVLAAISSGTLTLAGGNNITVSQAGNAVTISGAAAGGAQTAISGISASDTLYTSGTVKITGSNMVTVKSGAAQAVVIDATQSVQPVGSAIATGNTTGTTASIPLSGNLGLEGGNKITLSQSSGASSTRLVISAADQTAQTQSNIQGVAGSNTTYNTGTVELTGSNMITVKSSANQRLVIDATQSAQTQSNIQSIAASNTTYSTGQVEFTGSNIVTVKSSANQRVVIDASQSVQPVGSLDLAGNTTGTMATIPFASNIELAGGNNITLSQSSGASSSRITISAASQSVQTQNLHNVTLSGNTAGVLAAISSGTMTLAGGNNITVSQAGNAVTISGANVGGAQTGISSIAASNTTYTSGQVEFTGSNAVTVKSSANQRVVIDAPTQTVQPVGSLDLAGNTTGTMATIPFASNIELAGGNNITLSQSSGASSSRITISAASQSVQPVGSVGATGNTTGTTASIPLSGNLGLEGGNNITLSQSSGASSTRLVISAASQTVQTQSNIQSIAASNTTYQTGQVEFTGSNMITVKSSANQRVVIDATQSVQPVGSAVPAGNTTGTTASLPFSGNVGVAGGANITISQSTGAASTNLTIIGGAGAGGGVQHLVASDNTFSSGTVSITGLGDITVNTAASKIQISGSQSVQPGVQHLVASDNTFSSGTVSISGSNNITVATAASKIFVSGPNTTVQTYPTEAAFSNMPDGDLVGLPAMTAISKTPIYFPIDVPGNMTLNSIGLRISNVTTNTAVSLSAHFGLYTLVNSTSMALLGSGSDAFVVSTASSVSYSNGRDFVLTSPSTVAGISNITPGHYVAGLMFSGTAAGVLNATLLGATNASQFAAIGRIMPGTNQLSTATSQGANPLYGQGSTTVNALPANVVASEVKNQGTVAASMPVTPYLFIRS